MVVAQSRPCNCPGVVMHREWCSSDSFHALVEMEDLIAERHLVHGHVHVVYFSDMPLHSALGYHAPRIAPRCLTKVFSTARLGGIVFCT